MVCWTRSQHAVLAVLEKWSAAGPRPAGAACASRAGSRRRSPGAVSKACSCSDSWPQKRHGVIRESLNKGKAGFQNRVAALCHLCVFLQLCMPPCQSARWVAGRLAGRDGKDGQSVQRSLLENPSRTNKEHGWFEQGWRVQAPCHKREASQSGDLIMGPLGRLDVLAPLIQLCSACPWRAIFICLSPSRV